MSFDRLGLSPELLLAVAQQGYTEPTPVQAESIPLVLAGRDVLAGRRDAVALNGIDEWRGGVHLVGRDRSPWRWDARAQTLVS